MFSASLVAYVSGLSGPPEPKFQPAGFQWKPQDCAVQIPKIQKTMEALQVQLTVDAFSLEETARFKRWWGPGSPETND